MPRQQEELRFIQIDIGHHEKVEKKVKSRIPLVILYLSLYHQVDYLTASKDTTKQSQVDTID